MKKQNSKIYILLVVCGVCALGLVVALWWQIRIPAVRISRVDVVETGSVQNDKELQGEIIATYNPFSEVVAQAAVTSEPRITTLPQVYPGWYAQRLPILMYHMVKPLTTDMNTTTRRITTSPEIFEAQLKFLQKNGYTTWFIRDAMQLINANKKLPPRSVVLTFDDGTRDFYENVLPLLNKYNIKAVAYVNPDITTNTHFMNLEMLREVAVSGLVEVGSHTGTHQFLTDLGEEEQTLQIAESKKKLEALIGEPVVSFSYPFGAFTLSVLKEVEAAGYSSAASAYYGTVAAQKYRFMLPRILVGDIEGLDGFVGKITRD